jgi:hypothetical protein
MRRVLLLAAVAAAFSLGGNLASAQTVVFDFEDLTDQGWGSGFGANDASANHAIVNIGGSNRMQLNLGGFQVGSINSSANPYLAAINTALANPGISTISYDWYVDTTGFVGANFLQGGTYINAGQGAFPYEQDFPAVKDFELGGVDLASGGVFQGTVTETVSAKWPLASPDFQNAPSMRFGLILNGDTNAQNVKVYFDNITIIGVPEPASLAILGLAIPALVGMRRRRY